MECGAPMTKEQMLSVVQGQLEAYNRRDIELFCRFFHPEVKTFRLVPVLEQRVNAMAEFRAGYEKMFAESPKLHCEIKSRIVMDESVIDEEWVTGSANFPGGIHASAVYAFRDGLIDRVWFTR